MTFTRRTKTPACRHCGRPGCAYREGTKKGYCDRCWQARQDAAQEPAPPESQQKCGTAAPEKISKKPGNLPPEA